MMWQRQNSPTLALANRIAVVGRKKRPGSLRNRAAFSLLTATSSPAALDTA